MLPNSVNQFSWPGSNRVISVWVSGPGERLTNLHPCINMFRRTLCFLPDECTLGEQSEVRAVLACCYVTVSKVEPIYQLRQATNNQGVTEKTKITKSRNWTHGPVSLTNLLFFLHKYPKSLILKSVHFFRFWPMFLLKWQQMAGKIAWLPNRVVSFQRKMNCAPQSAVKNAKKGSASETSVSCFFSARLLRARRQNTCLRELQSSLEDTRSAWQRLRLSWSQGNKTSQYFHSRKGKTTCK